MAQPYAGSNHGMHFPLHKDTEVLLTFIDGDPDRPIIAAAVPNPETKSPVNANNQTMSAITTAGGNKIHIEDQAGSERILMHSPTQKSFIRVGAPNDPAVSENDGDDYTSTTHWGIAEKTDGWLDIQAQSKNEIILGEYTSWVALFRLWFTLGWALSGVFGGRWDLHLPDSLTFKNKKREANVDEFRDEVNHVIARGMRKKFNAMEQRIAGDVQHDIIESLDAADNDLLLTGQNVDALALRARAIKTRFRAQTQRVDVAGNKVEALADGMHNAGVEMKTAGTSLQNAASHAENAGASVSDAGLHLKNAGTIMQQTSALLLQN